MQTSKIIFSEVHKAFKYGPECYQLTGIYIILLIIMMLIDVIMTVIRILCMLFIHTDKNRC
jgi:uncharacterized membrane protein